jgi:DNA polymerase-4
MDPSSPASACSPHSVDALRAILHVDMDAFFASVEQRDNPALRGKPVLVGGGVVTAASYEARKYGCHSAQPIGQALRCCPHAIIVRGSHDKYREASRQVFEIFHRFSPLVQGLSIDEAFLDVTGSQRLFGDAVHIARTIRQQIADTVNLTASVGVAWNKFLAKLASDLDKPDGLTVLTPDDIDGRVAALPIKRMWGVGPNMERALRAVGITTFRHLREHDPEQLVERFGEHATRLQELAAGIDHRPVHTEHGVKSVSKESTFFDPVTTRDKAREIIGRKVERVAERLRAKQRMARTVTLKLRFPDFRTITRSLTLEHPTDRTDVFHHAAMELFDQWAGRNFQPLRLIGFGVSQLELAEHVPHELFPDPDDDRRRRLDRAADAIRTRFGRDSLHRGHQST